MKKTAGFCALLAGLLLLGGCGETWSIEQAVEPYELVHVSDCAAAISQSGHGPLMLCREDGYVLNLESGQRTEFEDNFAPEVVFGTDAVTAYAGGEEDCAYVNLTVQMTGLGELHTGLIVSGDPGVIVACQSLLLVQEQAWIAYETLDSDEGFHLGYGVAVLDMNSCEMLYNIDCQKKILGLFKEDGEIYGVTSDGFYAVKGRKLSKEMTFPMAVTGCAEADENSLLLSHNTTLYRWRIGETVLTELLSWGDYVPEITPSQFVAGGDESIYVRTDSRLDCLRPMDAAE